MPAVVFLITLGLCYVLYSKFGSSQREDSLDRSIAVMAFENMSGSADQEYLSDGISEEIINLLTKVPDLTVIGRTSSFYFKNKNEDLRVIGEKLGVAHVLEGSMRKDGENLRITVQLISTEDGRNLWSETYDRKMEGIFELQDEIAGAVLAQLKLKLLGSSSSGMAPATSLEVHALTLKANYFYDQGNFNRAREYLEQSLAIDSTNAQTWAFLANVLTYRADSSHKSFHATYEVIRRYAARAIDLDNQCAEAHRATGLIKSWYDLDWEGAENEFKLSIELEPGNFNAYRNLGQLKSILGDEEVAATYYEKALVLNPFNRNAMVWLYNSYIKMSRFNDALRLAEKIGEIYPSFNKAEIYKAEIYVAMGKPDDALKQLEQIGDVKSLLAAQCYFLLGRIPEASEIFDQTLNDSTTSSFEKAQIHALQKKNDQAFHWLEKAYVERYRMNSIKYDPFISSLREDPRYVDLLRRMNLPVD